MIEVRGLTKYFGSKKVLDNIDFEIKDPGVVGLLGLNGAGKSTTMNIMTGCLATTAGSVFVFGADVVKEPLAAKAHIGYLPETPPLYPDMRVGEYLSFVYELKGLKEDRNAHINRICEEAGVAEVKRRLIRNLSKGYRQRVGLAQALLGDPDVLILDEPTVGLDPSQLTQMRTLICKKGETGIVLLSSHIMQEIHAVCSRVLVLKSGVLAADLSTETLEPGAARLEEVFLELVKEEYSK